MSIRFAAAGAGECGAVARVLRRPRLRAPANDHENGAETDTLLQSALQHFARHGLGAAERARNIALRAFFEGDRDQYRHWLGICRKLDRQMANRLSLAHRSVEDFETLASPD
ncbi:hypothetical protein [Novosphingobium sp. KACC 22771]|uniref:hypothetical protein n=1 Tax=Novosphingobium sp. KACC 22771 TaxID=3025670 RepID=UPI002366381C|nr:hypothetical protein [Novosphingobium sp. KACC 22771]WDF71018.1 hypothetical protein PQ467_09200 [Novosphingobium sp. KACC 22771]